MVRKTIYVANQSGPQFLHIFGRVGNVVRHFELVRSGASQLCQVQLEAAVEAADLGLDFDHVALLKPSCDFGKVIPHAGFYLPRAVAQGDRQVLAAILAATQLLGGDGKESDDGLVFELTYIGDENFLHFACITGSPEARQRERPEQGSDWLRARPAAGFDPGGRDKAPAFGPAPSACRKAGSFRPSVWVFSHLDRTNREARSAPSGLPGHPS